MKKKISTLFGLLILLFCMSSISIASISGKCGDDVTWTLDESTKTLTISGSGKMYDYDSYRRPIPTGSYDTIIIKEGITYVGTDAFNRNKASTVVMSDTVESIGSGAFSGCHSLKTVVFGKNLKEIKYGAFGDCTALQAVTLGQNLESIENGAFSYCAALKTVTLGQNLKSIGVRAFSSCTSLNNVSIPASVESIGPFPFEWCSNLTNLQIDSGNKNYVSSDGLVFNKEKSKLLFCLPGKKETVTVPSSVVYIGARAFCTCAKLKKIVIPGTVKQIGEDFRNPLGGLIPEVFQFNTKLEAIVFKGDAPYFYENSLTGTTVTIYYPKGNKTWSSDLRKRISEFNEVKIIWKTLGQKDNTITAKDIKKTSSFGSKTYKIGAIAQGKAKLTYKSDNKSIKVDSKGNLTVSAKYIGKATITITAAETDTYKKASKTITVTILPSTKVEFLKEPQKKIDKSLGSLIYFELKKSTGNPDCRIQVSTASDFNAKAIVVNTTRKYDASYKIPANGNSIKTGKTYYIRIMWTKNGVSSGKWTTYKGKVKL